MAARRASSKILGYHEQTLMGIGVIAVFATFSREASTALSHLCFRPTEALLNVLACLLIGEGRLLAAHMLDFQRLLDGYCLLASVVPLLHCILGLR
jgi:hypothetical protein